MLLEEWRLKEDPSKLKIDSLKSLPDGYFPASSEGLAKFADDFFVGVGTVLEGLFADRPAAGVAGRIYHATDTDDWYLDNGTSWEEIQMPANLDIPAGPPGDPTGLTATALPLQILLRWTANTEADLDRYIVYRGTSPNPTSEYTRVDTTYFSDANVTVGTTYYYRIKARDRVGNLSGYSNEVNASPQEAYTPTDPSPPTLTADNIEVQTVVDKDGTTGTCFVVTFVRVENAYGYILSFRKIGTTECVHLYAEQVASGNVVIKTGFVELNTVYYFKVCSLNEFQEGSAWSAEVSKTSGIDATPPGVPANLSSTSLYGGVLLEWDKVSAYDFDHYNIYVSNTSTPPAEAIFTTMLNRSFYRTDDYDVTKYFWVSSVDMTGNESNKCAYVTGAALQIHEEDIKDLEVTSAKIYQVLANKILIDGTVYLSNWRHGTDLTKIDGGKIYTGSVLADQIGANQIVIGKLAAETLARIFSGSDVKTAIEAWRHASDLTLIDGGDIYTNSITTKKIAFSRVASQAAENALGLTAGNLIWRSDVNQLRFKSDEGMEEILKEPLYSAPPENQLLNQAFEEDRSADGVPDYWTTTILSGSPSFHISTAFQYKGGQSAYIFLDAPGEGKFLSAYIPVTPGQKVVLEVAYRGSLGKTHPNSVALMEWFNEDKGAFTESNPPDDWKTTTTAWVKKSQEFTVPAGKYYARVSLRNHCISGYVETVYYDDICLSVQRSLIPTAGVVATAEDGGTETMTDIANAAWRDGSNFVVPSGSGKEHEMFVVQCWFRQTEQKAFLTRWFLRLKLTKAGETTEYYPQSNQASFTGLPYLRINANTYECINVNIFIPKDRQGWTVTLQMYWDYATADTVDGESYISGYGINPHSHR